MTLEKLTNGLKRIEEIVKYLELLKIKGYTLEYQNRYKELSKIQHELDSIKFDLNRDVSDTSSKFM